MSCASDWGVNQYLRVPASGDAENSNSIQFSDSGDQVAPSVDHRVGEKITGQPDAQGNENDRANSGEQFRRGRILSERIIVSVDHGPEISGSVDAQRLAWKIVHRNRSSSSSGRKIIPRGRKRSRRNASLRRKRNIRLKRRSRFGEAASGYASDASLRTPRRETRLGGESARVSRSPIGVAEPRREMASSSQSVSKRKPGRTSHFVALRSQIRPQRPALMQSLRASATPLDPPSKWLT